MNKMDIASWYANHSGQVLIVFGAPVAVAWFLYFQHVERQEPVWLIIGAIAGVYYLSRNHLKNYCYRSIVKHSKEFSSNPNLDGNTSENILDTIDMDIMTKLNEMEEDKGEYLKMMGTIDIIDPEELLKRLGKMKSLGYIHATSRKVTLTSVGLSLINSTSGIQQILLPTKFSTLLARAKIRYEDGNYNGVADTINILFEDILRSLIESNMESSLSEKWQQLQKDNIVRRDFDKCGLGELLGACNYLKIIPSGSIEDHMISSFLKLRTPQKHSLKKEQEPQLIAQSALELANIFIREQFQR